MIDRTIYSVIFLERYTDFTQNIYEKLCASDDIFRTDYGTQEIDSMSITTMEHVLTGKEDRMNCPITVAEIKELKTAIGEENWYKLVKNEIQSIIIC